MRIKKGTLILVSDGAKMLLFRNDSGVDTVSLTTLLEEEAENLSTREQGTDTPGRTQSRLGDRRSSYEETDWRQQAEDEFARHSAAALEEAAASEGVADVIIAAAPRTLGELRKHYGPETRRRMLCEIDKDLANSSRDDIVRVIDGYGES